MNETQRKIKKLKRIGLWVAIAIVACTISGMIFYPIAESLLISGYSAGLNDAPPAK